MIVRLTVTVDAGVFYRDEDWFHSLPIPVVEDHVMVEGREYRVYMRVLKVGLSGPFATIELAPIKMPFVKTGWFMMEDPPRGD